MIGTLYEIFIFLISYIAEPLYFGIFLIIGKNIKQKRLLLICIMVIQYLLLVKLFPYNIWFQLIYTFMSFVNLKVLYKEKAQITDIFLFAFASIILIIISLISYSIINFTIQVYTIALILNRILMILFLLISKKAIKNKYNEFCSLWNRHNNPTKIRSLTLRNISIIAFNLMFWLLNIGIVFSAILNTNQ